MTDLGLATGESGHDDTVFVGSSRGLPLLQFDDEQLVALIRPGSRDDEVDTLRGLRDAVFDRHPAVPRDRFVIQHLGDGYQRLLPRADFRTRHFTASPRFEGCPDDDFDIVPERVVEESIDG